MPERAEVKYLYADDHIIPFSMGHPHKIKEIRRQWVHSPEKGKGAVWVDENGEWCSPVSFGKEKPVRKLDAPLMGVREWNVGNDGALYSTGMANTWTLGVQRAKCESFRSYSFSYTHSPTSMPWVNDYESYSGHPAPYKGCGCGLYGFYDREALKKHGDGFAQKEGVSGVVSAWGKIIRCAYGFRAEYMKVEAFIVEKESMEWWGSSIDLLPAHRFLAEMHGVPLIKPDEVSAFMGLSGGSVLESQEGTSHVSSDPSNVVFGSPYAYHVTSVTSPYVTSPVFVYRDREAGLTPKWSKDHMKGGKSDAGD
jgi:hypothetical protein